MKAAPIQKVKLRRDYEIAVKKQEKTGTSGNTFNTCKNTVRIWTVFLWAIWLLLKVATADNFSHSI